MSCLCYQRLETLTEMLNKQGLSSYSDYDQLKANGTLDAALSVGDTLSEFQREVTYFFNVLESDYYKNNPAFERMVLHQLGIVEVFRRFGYIFSLYLNNTDAYRVFPLFMLEAAKRFNIPKYKHLSFEAMFSLLNDKIDIARAYDYKYKRDLIEVLPRTPNPDYDKYDLSKVDYYNKDYFYMYAEHQAFLEECNRLANKNDYSMIIHTARNKGDGYGYDVYSYDDATGIENLIEVKSGLSTSTSITLNEYKIMLKTRKQPKVDYYVYKYYYDGKELHIHRLKFDKEKEILIGEDGMTYFLSPYITYNDEGKREFRFSIEEQPDLEKCLRRER